jgi:predicted TIM-barrel fold metal-dependent hydrolase
MAFVFSADSHLGEPRGLFSDALPLPLKEFGLVTAKTEDELQVRLGERVLVRHKLNDGNHGAKRHGSSDLTLRKEDMAADGIDAEILFPQLGLMVYHIAEPEAERLSCRAYNDWARDHVSNDLDRWVPTALLPVRDLKNTLGEFEHALTLGYTAVMLPAYTREGIPTYNLPDWDPIFALAAESATPIVFHCGTGRLDPVVMRGPGGAIYNYTHLINDSMNVITLLVGGGVLDRTPGAHIVSIEAGASWLPALAERMDEVYRAHQFYVRPKLSALPSEIVARQVHCSFQFDKAGIVARKALGHQTLLWGADYPHMEGTFPNSKTVLDHLFDGIEIGEAEKADIIGGTAARLFKLADRERSSLPQA